MATLRNKKKNGPFWDTNIHPITGFKSFNENKSYPKPSKEKMKEYRQRLKERKLNEAAKTHETDKKK